MINSCPDRDQIITIAACHTCGAYRGEPCTFAPCEDPDFLRRNAHQSHSARVILAKKKWQETLAKVEITV